jgi:hypothetical protein
MIKQTITITANFTTRMGNPLVTQKTYNLSAISPN